MKILVIHGLKKPFSADPRKRQNTWVHRLANDLGGEPFFWSGTLSGMEQAIRDFARYLRKNKPDIVIAKSMGAIVAEIAIKRTGLRVKRLIRVGAPCDRKTLYGVSHEVVDIVAPHDWVNRCFFWVGRLLNQTRSLNSADIQTHRYYGYTHHDLGQDAHFYSDLLRLPAPVSNKYLDHYQMLVNSGVGKYEALGLTLGLVLITVRSPK